jgi:hypothetical protein
MPWLWHAVPVRGSGRTARVAAVAVVVLSALALVALAARSERAVTVTAAATPTVTPSAAPITSGRYQQPDGGEAKPGKDTSGGEMPDALVVVVSLAIVVLGASAVMVFAVAVRPRVELPDLGGGGPDRPGAAAPAADATDPARLAAAVRVGLEELAEGGPGEGVIACWVQLERAAADAGTHRVRPDTPSELAGRLIDRHDVSPAPLLRLAELYREARYSRHVLPESARTEARVALEQVATELAARPAGALRAAAHPPGARRGGP